MVVGPPWCREVLCRTVVLGPAASHRLNGSGHIGFKYVQVDSGEPEDDLTWDGTGWVYAHALLAYIMKGDSSGFHGTNRQGNSHVTLHSLSCRHMCPKAGVPTALGVVYARIDWAY